MSRYNFVNQVFYIHGKFLYIHVKTIYSLSMRLACYQFFFISIYVHNSYTSRRTGDELGLLPNVLLGSWQETDMADERSENFEELVRRIVHSVNRNKTINSNENESISNLVQNRASTVEEELNQQFLLPQGAASNDSTRAQDVAAHGYTNYRSRKPSRQRNTPYGSQGNEHQHHPLTIH